MWVLPRYVNASLYSASLFKGGGDSLEHKSVNSLDTKAKSQVHLTMDGLPKGSDCLQYESFELLDTKVAELPGSSVCNSLVIPLQSKSCDITDSQSYGYTESVPESPPSGVSTRTRGDPMHKCDLI